MAFGVFGCISEIVRCRKLILGRDIGVCSPEIFETSFSYDQDIWIAATDYYMHFYIIMLFPLTAILSILQLINFSASKLLV